MTFTKDDIQTIKTLLAQQKLDIIEATNRKITTAQTNIERKIATGNTLRDSMTQAGIKREIQTTEDNLRQEIREQGQTLQKAVKEQTAIVLELVKNLHSETIQAIGGMADIVATQKEVDEHTKRIEKIEHLQKAA